MRLLAEGFDNSIEKIKLLAGFSHGISPRHGHDGQDSTKIRDFLQDAAKLLSPKQRYRTITPVREADADGSAAHTVMHPFHDESRREAFGGLKRHAGRHNHAANRIGDIDRPFS